MKLYVASSWRNDFQPDVVASLRDLGFEVYDFKNPAEGDHGFSWKEIEPDYENWTTDQYIRILDHPISQRGFDFDFDAMKAADACVLVLPCGRSAHIEAGWFIGAGRPVFIYIPTPTTEPELMYKMATGVYSDFQSLFDALRQTPPTHYVVQNSGNPNVVFVKEAAYFEAQGGLTENWGKTWRPVIAKDIEDARRIGAEIFGAKLSHIYGAAA